MTNNDPAVRRVMARQLWMFRKLKREGKSHLYGYKPPQGDCVSRLWAREGWRPAQRKAA